MLEGQVSPYATYSQAIVRQAPPAPLAHYSHYAPHAPPPRGSIWDTYRAMLAPNTEPTGPMQSAVTGLRHNAEGMAIAGLLAFAERQLGSLDVRGKYPIDGILSALFFALSVKEAGKPDGYASDLRALSQSCSSVLVYRKVRDYGKTEPVSVPSIAGDTVAKSTIPQNTNDDPILRAARAVGF